MQVLFQQFTTVWRCQKWHCLNRFYAVIKHAASNATKCILDIPPHLFFVPTLPHRCRYMMLMIWSTDWLQRGLGCSSQSSMRPLTNGVNGCMPVWKRMDDTLSTCCDCPDVLLLFLYFICILSRQLTDIASWFWYLSLWTLVRFLSGVSVLRLKSWFSIVKSWSWSRVLAEV